MILSLNAVAWHSDRALVLCHASFFSALTVVMSVRQLKHWLDMHQSEGKSAADLRFSYTNSLLFLCQGQTNFSSFIYYRLFAFAFRQSVCQCYSSMDAVTRSDLIQRIDRLCRAADTVQTKMSGVIFQKHHRYLNKIITWSEYRTKFITLPRRVGLAYYD